MLNKQEGLKQSALWLLPGKSWLSWARNCTNPKRHNYTGRSPWHQHQCELLYHCMNKHHEKDLEVSRMRLDKSLVNLAWIQHWSCSKQKSGLEVQKGLWSFIELIVQVWFLKIHTYQPYMILHPTSNGKGIQHWVYLKVLLIEPRGRHFCFIATSKVLKFVSVLFLGQRQNVPDIFQEQNCNELS